MNNQTPFQHLMAQVGANERLREPQCDADAAISERFDSIRAGVEAELLNE